MSGGGTTVPASPSILRFLLVRDVIITRAFGALTLGVQAPGGGVQWMDAEHAVARAFDAHQGDLIQDDGDGTVSVIVHPHQAGKVLQTTADGWEFIDTPSGGLPASNDSGNLLAGDAGGAWNQLEHPDVAGKIIQTTAAGWEFIDTPSGGLPAPTATGSLLKSTAVGWQEWRTGNLTLGIIRSDGSGGFEFLEIPDDTRAYILRYNPDTQDIEWVEEMCGEAGHWLPGEAADYDMWLRWWWDDTEGWPAWDYLP